MIISVEGVLKSYADIAIGRLKYLYPTVHFSLIPDGIEATGDPGVSSEKLSREIHYALYREKIYAETLSMRCSLIEELTRR